MMELADIVTRLDNIERILARIELNTDQHRRAKIAIAIKANDPVQRIVQCFFEDAILKTANPGDRITRDDLHRYFIAYYFQYLRREVTDHGMPEEEATRLMQQRPNSYTFTQAINRFIKTGVLPQVATGSISGKRAWIGLATRTWVQDMLEDPDHFDLQAQAPAGIPA